MLCVRDAEPREGEVDGDAAALPEFAGDSDFDGDALLSAELDAGPVGDNEAVSL